MAGVDVDAFVMANRASWDRLEHLVKKRRRLSGAEAEQPPRPLDAGQP